jgi:hypothetical protein
LADLRALWGHVAKSLGVPAPTIDELLSDALRRGIEASRIYLRRRGYDTAEILRRDRARRDGVDPDEPVVQYGEYVREPPRPPVD